MSHSNKALFLDRDGVINIDHGYVSEPSKFEFIEGVFEACKKFQELGYKIIVITNQSGIGRGYYDENTFWKLTEWMIGEFNQHSVDIASVQFCPHHPEKALPPYKQNCDCRKPEPGMILAAINEHDVDPQASIFVGDKPSDILAARSANVRTKILVRSGQTFSDQEANLADAVFDSLADFAQDFDS